jgi:acyl carrier protein
MNLTSVLAQLQPLIAEALGLEPDACPPQARLTSDLGAESIDLVDLTFRIEKTFGIQIPEGELFEDTARRGHDLTVEQVAAYIAARLEQSPPPR